MRPEECRAEDLARLLRVRTIATMSELKGALGSEADVTVLRQLEALAARELLPPGPVLHPR